jgi:drug/metabolite transporter (DMT)-like permease
MTRNGWILLIAAAAAMATSLPLNNMLVADLAPLTLALLRVAMGLPVLLMMVAIAGIGLPLARRDLATAAIGGLLHVALPFAAIAWGQQHIPSGLGGILYATTPLLTAAFAHMLTASEKLTDMKLAGVVLGMIGVGLIVGWSALQGAGSHLLGVAVSLAGPVGVAFGSVMLRRRSALHPLALTATMYCLALAILLPLALLIEGPIDLEFSATTAALLFTLATVGTILPTLLNYTLIRESGATNASLVMFLMPVIAVALGAMLLGEPVAGTSVAGMGLILAGSYLVVRHGPR